VSDRITVQLTDVDIDAVTDALLFIEAGAARALRQGTLEWDRLARIVRPLREARDRALDAERAS
jgi:hypothetical protein